MSKTKLWVFGLAAFTSAVVGVYTWSETYEIRMCRSMNSGRTEVPGTIGETHAGIHALIWSTLDGRVERGRRSVSPGETEYTLVCDPAAHTCSLGWVEAGVSIGRSQCVHPGGATAMDYF